MSRKTFQPRIYHSKRPVRTAVTVVVSLLVALVLLFIILFFSLKRHIAFDGGRLYLDIPWLQEELTEIREGK